MGERLSDPSPAPVMQVNARFQGEGGGGAYGGATTLVVQRVNEDPRQEWKTPPLWGVRDSGPYLHDGRAETIEAAVLYHGGEATDSVTRFRELTTVERTQMLTFLGTLAAPDPADLR
jgi:cytochrome c peroxidase